MKTEINPFIHRWKLDDPKWVKARKQQWKDVVAFLRGSIDPPKKYHKYWRTFFLTGEEISNQENELIPIYFPPIYRLFYTPSDSLEEAKEVVESIRPREMYKVLQQAQEFDCGYVGHERGMIGENIKYIVRALFPKQFEPLFKIDNTHSYRIHLEPIKFIAIFERHIIYFLTGANCSCYYAVQYLIEHWLSCLEYLEKSGELPENDCERNALISSARHFIEPRARHDEDTPQRNFAKKLCQRLQHKNRPNTIKKIWKSLDPLGIFEEKQDSECSFQVHMYIFSDYTKCSPYERILENIRHSKALLLLLESAKNLSFCDKEAMFSPSTTLNIAPILSEGFKAELGYSASEQAIMAHRFDLQLNKKFICSNSKEPKIWVEFYTLYPNPNSDINSKRTIPTVLYFLRLSEYYKIWKPSIGMLLNELQFRNEFHRLSGIHLLDYIDYLPKKQTTSENNLNFLISPYSYKKFNVFNDYKDGLEDLGILGLDTMPWKGQIIDPPKLTNY